MFFCVLIFPFKVFCALPNSHSCTGVCASLYFYDNLGKEITFVKVGIWISTFCCCIFRETKYQTYLSAQRNILVSIVCPPGNWRYNVQRKKKSERGRWGSSCRTRLLQVKMGTNILIMGAAVLVIKIHDTKQCGVSQLNLVTI